VPSISQKPQKHAATFSLLSRARMSARPLAQSVRNGYICKRSRMLLLMTGSTVATSTVGQSAAGYRSSESRGKPLARLLRTALFWSMAGFLSVLAREENKKPASPEDLARNLQLFILFRTGIIADCAQLNNTGKALSSYAELL